MMVLLRKDWSGMVSVHVYVVVEFYCWLKFSFLLFQTHYHTLPYPKTQESNMKTKDKIEPQHI